MSEIGQRLISIVREKAAANPDFVYDEAVAGCVYIHGGQPSCIFGHALLDAGLISPDISDAHNRDPIHQLIHSLDLELDESEEKWMRKVQQLQDNAWTWGSAVRRADTLAGINA